MTNAHVEFQERAPKDGGRVDVTINGIVNTTVVFLLNATKRSEEVYLRDKAIQAQLVDDDDKPAVPSIRSQDIDEHVERFTGGRYVGKNFIVVNFDTKHHSLTTLPRDKSVYGRFYTYCFYNNRLYLGDKVNEPVSICAVHNRPGGSPRLLPGEILPDGALSADVRPPPLEAMPTSGLTEKLKANIKKKKSDTRKKFDAKKKSDIKTEHLAGDTKKPIADIKQTKVGGSVPGQTHARSTGKESGATHRPLGSRSFSSLALFSGTGRAPLTMATTGVGLGTVRSVVKGFLRVLRK